VCVRTLGGNPAGWKRFGLILNSPHVSIGEMLDTVAERTARAAAGRAVLVIQDTTELNYAAHAGRVRGLGTVGNGTDHGFFVHPLLVLDAADGAVLGLAGAIVWQRHETHRAFRRTRPIEDKESHRWIEGMRQAAARLAAAAPIIQVMDCEGDGYEVLAAERPPQVELVVRAAQDRRTREGPTLYAHARSLPPAARFELELRAEPGRAARTAELELRFGPVTLLRPAHAPRHLPEQVSLSLVEVHEPAPPADGKPIVWRLLTSRGVADAATARQIVRTYQRRWEVEQLFRTMKRQGFNVEESQLTSAAALERMAVLVLIAATRTLQLTRARDGGPRPAGEAFGDAEIEGLHALAPTLEGKTALQKNPYPADSLGWAAWIIARLGGWSGYRSQRPPGPITFCHGLTRFHAIIYGYALAQHEAQAMTAKSPSKLVGTP
jgi:Transposase DDE domain